MPANLLAYFTAVLQLTKSIAQLPQFPNNNNNNFDDVNIRFYSGSEDRSYNLYDAHNITQLLQDKAYNANRSTVLFVSGWMMSPTAETSALLIDAYLRYQNCNMLVLDWSKHSVGLYTSVMYRISKISRMYGRNLVKLFNGGLSDKTFHCVGHSFGAHSCGIMGREVQKYSNKRFKFSRISGLDPAGPNFFPKPLHEQPLGRQDATFVDTIHSDTFFIGTKVPLGHATFYPNYNMIQPGCPSFSLNSFFDYVNDMCSHFHAIRYWVETLNPRFTKLFPCDQCSDWNNFQERRCEKSPINYMGIDANPNIQGTFFIKITSKRYFDGKQFYDWLINRIGGHLHNFIPFDFFFVI